MVVIIPHPTEELIFAKLQKQLISELFEDGRIMYAVKPLWIEVNTVVEPVETTAEHELSEVCGILSKIELGDFEISEGSIFIPVTITTETAQHNSKLTLVNLHSGRQFTDSDRQTISKIKQPVRQVKVFRLGLEKELSPNSKCITESKWVKLHNSTTTVK